MTNPYDSQSISGYNSSPPADDGSEVASNQVSWAKHKDKLADPIKTLAEGMNTESLAAFGKVYLGFATNAQTTNYSIIASDERKAVECTNTITVTLLPVVTAGDGFTLAITNVGTGVVTVEGNTSELVGGALNQVLAKTGDSLILQCNGTSWKILADSRTSYEVAINEAKGADIASATTTDIGAATGNQVDITGTTTITGLGTVQAGTRREVEFDGILTLTHNATSLILPAAANITTAAGDTATFISLGSGNWRCHNYQRGSGQAVAFDFSPTFESSEQTVTASADLDVAHSLGVVPTFVQVVLRCKTAELGFAVGDEIFNISLRGTGEGATFYANATNVSIITESNIAVVARSLNTHQFITAASWRWVVRAWV